MAANFLFYQQPELTHDQCTSTWSHYSPPLLGFTSPVYLEKVLLSPPRLFWWVKEGTLSGEKVLHFSSPHSSLLPWLSVCKRAVLVSLSVTDLTRTVSSIFQMRFCPFLDQRYFPASNENTLHSTSQTCIACVIGTQSLVLSNSALGHSHLPLLPNEEHPVFLKLLVLVAQWMTLQFILACFVPLVVEKDCCLSLIFSFFEGCFVFLN